MEILICLAWETNHQRSADVNAWHAFADGLQQIDGFLLRYVAMHAGEHVVADVLEGNVEIFAYVWLLAHHVQKIHRELVRISIMQANPFHARNISHLPMSDLMDAISLDKKNLNNHLNLVLLHQIGDSYVYPADLTFFDQADEI